MTIKANYPAIRPSLLLDFANSKSLDPRITFTRASTARYTDKDGLIKVAAANTPRFDFDPITLACKGLLIEEARTNLLKYSESFDDAAWSKTRAVIIPNASVAPDGMMTADKLIEDSTTTDTHKADQQATFGTGALCFSVRAKAGERSKLQLYATDLVSSICYASFDLANGVVLGSTFKSAWSQGSASIRDIGNGWYECVLAATTSQGTVKRPEIRILNDDGIDTYTGDGVSGLYLWGAQLEAGSFPTSYIPTTSAQATRAADIASMTGANFSSWYRQDEGTFVVESDTSAVTATDKRTFAVTNGSASAAMTQHYATASGGVYSSAITNGGVYQYGQSEGPYLANTLDKRAFSYKDRSPISVTNGVLGSVAGSATADCPTGLNRLDIGSRLNTQFLNGHIARITYFPKRLSNADLQALTS